LNEELRLIISAEIEDLKKEIQNANKQVKGFEKQGKESGGNFSKAMAAAGKATGAAMKAVGAAIVAGAAAMIGLAESTREYRTEQAKLVSAFESAGGSAEQATETYNDLYRVLGDSGQATEAANLLAKMTTNQEELSEWTRICQGAYATFGDSMPIESLAEAANETAKTGEITGALADALNWAGVSEDEFTEKLFMANSEAEREQLIRETLNGLYGEAADNYEKNAASILAANEAQAALTAGMAALGAAVEPIITLFKAELAEVLQELAPHLETFASGLGEVATGVEGGAAKMAEGIKGIIDTVLNAIVELLPTLLGMGVGIIAALLEGISSALPEIISTLDKLLPQIIETIATLLPQITGAILNALPMLIELVINVVSEVLKALGEVLPEILKQIVAILPQIVDSIIEAIPELLDAAITFLMAIVDAIPEIIPPLLEELPEIVDSILDCLLDNLPILLDAAVMLFMALVDAIPAIIPPLVNAIPDIISSLIDAFISSTPMLAKGALDMFMAIVKAIPKIIPELIKGLGTLVSKVKENLVEKLKSALKFKWELPKLKMPSIAVAWKDSPKWMAEAAKFIGLQGIPSFKVNWNELGGVFDKPTVFGYGSSLQGIGENGAEAVVPLENNTEWLDKIAERLNRNMGGSAPIVLQVDGKTFARTAVATINNLTKTEGRLPLVLV